MADFSTIRAELILIRTERDRIEQELKAMREKLRRLEREVTLKRRKDRPGGPILSGLLAEIDALRGAIGQKRQRYVEACKHAQEQLELLNDCGPEESIIQQFGTNTPFLLFPVRLETRFMDVTPVGGPEEKQLWIRVYPDDISIDTHEEVLSESEVVAAQAYWQEIYTARQVDAVVTDGEDSELAAWRALAGAFGGNRSAWIVKTYVPDNLPIAPDPYPTAPTFAPYETKMDSWSQPPRASLLPDRFRFIGYVGDTIVFDASGRHIRDPLIVGPDPSQLEGEENSMGRDGEEIRLDPAMHWLGDVDAAVNVGMALKVTSAHIVTEKETGDAIWKVEDGLDRLIVLGIRASNDETEGQQALETLFDHHHYSTEGLSLLPQGTATNNTGSGAAGYSSFDLGEEESYAVEMGAPLFDNGNTWEDRSDGELLARWLGIEPEVFHHVQHAGGYDQRDARAMNTALFPGTLGYFMEEMMNPVFDAETVAETRSFFHNHVRARGAVPAIRKGKQPYGILASGPISRLYDDNDRDQNIVPFSVQLHSFLGDVQSDWVSMLDEVSHAGKEGDPYEILLDIVGLHGISAEFFERTVVGPDYFTNYMNFLGLIVGSVEWNSNLVAGSNEILDRLGYSTLADRPEILNLTFFLGQRLLDGPLVDDVPASEDEAIRTYTDDDRNYIQWLLESDLETIEDESFSADDSLEAPQSLLYLVLRHSVQLAWWDAAMKLQGYTDIAFKVEPELLHIEPASVSYSKLDFVHAKDSAVTGDDRTIATYMHEEDLSGESDAEVWEDVKTALEMLMDRPTAKLERAFVESLDACTYRLDAWQLGLVNEKFVERRLKLVPGGEGEEIWQKGILLGAFGWVEDLRPSSKVLAEVDTSDAEFPPELIPNDGKPLYDDSENAGYMHGPSLNHAVTAAVLRNGYLTHADADDADTFAVNLSSERVRTGLSLIEGVRHGQGLAELLGYQFERALHDRHEEVNMDEYIFPIRNEFPLYADVISDSEAGKPIDTKEARNVVDGLALLDHIRNEGGSAYPWGLVLKSDDTVANGIIDEEVGRIQDSLDAVSDLALSESVYQVVQGNYDRAGAIMAAISEGDNPQDPEIARPPRSGYALTQRVAIQFETRPSGYVVVPSADNPYDGIIDLTPRAEAELGLNLWLVAVMPDFSNIKCTASSPSNPNITVPLDALGMQPIDLLLVLGHRLDGTNTELDARVQYYVRETENLDDSAAISIDYEGRDTDWADDVITFFELAPLVGHLRRIVLGSRHLTAEDLHIAYEAEEDESVTTGIDTAQLEGRVNAAYTHFSDRKTALESATTAFELETLPSSLDFSALREALVGLGDIGVLQGYPTSAIEESETSQAALLAQAQSALEKLVARDEQYTELVTFAADESDASKISKWINAGAQLLGPGFKFIPAFDLSNADEMSNATSRDMVDFLSDSGTLFPTEDWLSGLAQVRPKMRHLEMAGVLAEAFDRAEMPLSTVQLPYLDGDKWLGLKVPADYDFESDKLLLNLYYASAFDPVQQQKGLVLDDWTEVIPTTEETTGVALHFDGPNSKAPNTLILALAPDSNNEWQWQDLLDTLHETLDMAKRRAVEPEQIDNSDYAQFLPSLMMAVSRYRTTISTNLLRNISNDSILNQKIEV